MPTVIMHLTGGNEPPKENEIGLDRIKRIVERAEKSKVNVALENIRSATHLKYAFENIQSSRLGFCYDSGHHNFTSPDEDILFQFGTRLMALHLHDNDGISDQHKMPFDGDVDWTDTMNKIAKTGYKGATALELINREYSHLLDKPEEFLKIAYERAKRLEELRV